MLQSNAGEGDVAAVAGANDAHARGVNHLLTREFPNAVGHIALHLAAPLAETGREVLPAKAVRTSKLRLQDGEPAFGKGLRPPVEPRSVAGRWTTVNKNDER